MKFARPLVAGVLGSAVTLSMAVIPSYATTRIDSPDKGATALAASGADAGTSGVWSQLSVNFLSRAGAVLGIATCKRWLKNDLGLNPNAYQYTVAYSQNNEAWVVLYRLIH